MSKGPSHHYARAVAAAAAVDAGLTRLGIALMTHVAGRGVNFQTDAQTRLELVKPNGLRYHRESIGRKRRELTRAGFLSARRYFAGKRPPGAKWTSGHGVVVTSVDWVTLKMQRPTQRGERQAQRAEARRQRGERREREPMSRAEVAAGARDVLAMLEGIGRRPPPGR